MSNVIPESWQQVNLEDLIIRMSNGANVDQLTEITNLPISRIETIWNGNIDPTRVKYIGQQDQEFIEKYSLNKNDILFSHINSDGHIGKTAIYKGIPEQLIHGINLLLIRVHDSIDADFINYQFKHLKNQGAFIAVAQRAVNQSSINQQKLKNFVFNIPPFKEQKRIVQKIEELFSEIDDGIQSLEIAKKQLEIYREATLIQAFEGQLTQEWRRSNNSLVVQSELLKSRFADERKNRYENEIEKWKASVKEWESKQLEGRKPTKPRAPKDVQKLTNDTLSTLPALPSEWYWDTLGNITSGVEYGTSAKSQESGSVPVIRMGNIQQGVIDWDDLVYTSDEQEIEQYELKAGDVLFNRTNSPELVGKTVIYKGEQPAIFAGYLIRVNHYSNLIDSSFLNYYLNSHIAKTYGNSVKTDGVNQSNINGEKLQNYPFPFCSLEEQQEIVKIISNFLDKEKVTRQYLHSELKRAHLLKQSILQKAFSGQLVPQDPNDEPASVLLERIKAEKVEELAKAKANKAPKQSGKRKTKAKKEDEPAQQELI